MPPFTLEALASFFAEKLHLRMAPEGIEEGMEISFDSLTIQVIPSLVSGGVLFRLPIGLLLQPISENHLKELVCSHYFNVNTGGCTFSFDHAGVTLFLQISTTASATLSEHWDWLHRLISTAREWGVILNQWEEFVALVPPPSEKD